MASRLFHTLVVCGAALAMLPLGCASDPNGGAGADDVPLGPDEAGGGTATADPMERCRGADGGCNEHCAPLADGTCLDPCFVHTESCSPACLLPSGECGWPPTK